MFAGVGVGRSKPPEGGAGEDVVNFMALKWLTHAVKPGSGA